jgi:hypothetical protein
MPIDEQVNSPVNRVRVKAPLPNPGKPTSPGAKSSPSLGSNCDPSPGNRPMTDADRSMRPGKPTVTGG